MNNDQMAEELINEVEVNTPGPDNGVIDTPAEVDYLTERLNSYKDYANSPEYNKWKSGEEMGSIISGLRFPERAYAARREFDDSLAKWNSDEYAGNDKSKRDQLGQFYTPPELAGQMIEMPLANAKTDEEVEQILRNEPVWDPTAGSGNLSAAEIMYGFDPNNVYANELDPSVMNDRLIPRLTGLGVPRANIRPWPNEYRYFGRFDDPDDVKQVKAQQLYNEYLQGPAYRETEAQIKQIGETLKGLKKQLKSDPSNEQLAQRIEELEKNRKELKGSIPSLKDFLDSYGAGNALNPQYMANVGKQQYLDKNLVNKMLEAEERGDTETADLIYKHLHEGGVSNEELQKQIEEAIERGGPSTFTAEPGAFMSEPVKHMVEEAEQLNDDNPNNDEVRDDVVEDYTNELAERNAQIATANEWMNDLGWSNEQIKDNKQTLAEFMNEYRDYMHYTDGELANWPLQRTETDYIRNRINEALPIFGLIATQASQMGEKPKGGFYSEDPDGPIVRQALNMTCEGLLAHYGITWDDGKLLRAPMDEDGEYEIPEDNAITYRDIENLSPEDKQILMNILLNEGAEEIRNLMYELPDLVNDWKYEWATKNGYQGSYDDWMQQVYEQAKARETKPEEPTAEAQTEEPLQLEDKSPEAQFDELRRKQAIERGAEEVKKEDPITQEALNAAKEAVDKVINDLFMDRRAYVKSKAEGGIEEDDLSQIHSEPTKEELSEYNKAIKEEWNKKSKEEKKQIVEELNKLISGLPQMYYKYGETATDKPGFKYDPPAINAPMLNEWEPYEEPLMIEDNTRAPHIPPTDDEFEWIIEDLYPIMELAESEGLHIKWPKFKVSKWNDIEKNPADDSYKPIKKIKFDKRGSGAGSFNRGLHGISGPGSSISTSVGKYNSVPDKPSLSNKHEWGEVADDITALKDSDEPIKGNNSRNKFTLNKFREDKKPVAGLSTAFGKGVNKSKSFTVKKNKLPSGQTRGSTSGGRGPVKAANVTNVGIKQRIISAAVRWPKHAKVIEGFIVKVLGDRVYIGPYTLDTFIKKYPDLIKTIVSKL